MPMKAQSGRLGEWAQPLDEVIESVFELVGRGGGGERFAESVKVRVCVGIELVEGVVPSRGVRRGGLLVDAGEFPDDEAEHVGEQGVEGADGVDVGEAGGAENPMGFLELV